VHPLTGETGTCCKATAPRGHSEDGGGVAYNSQECSPSPRCLPGIQKQVLRKIDAWIKAGVKGRPVFWLHGPVGAEKSAITQTVTKMCAECNELAASFFFA